MSADFFGRCSESLLSSTTTLPTSNTSKYPNQFENEFERNN
jgi:hypothetical protein